MEKSKKIGIVALCVLTFMIGVAFVSAKNDNSNAPWNQLLELFITNTETDPIPVSIEGTVTLDGPAGTQGPPGPPGPQGPPGTGGGSTTPETMCFEVARYDVFEIEEIEIETEGYKELQISYNFDAHLGYVYLYWRGEDFTHGQFTAGPPILFLSDTSESGFMSVPVRSNKLFLHLDNVSGSEGDYIKLILYATK